MRHDFLDRYSRLASPVHRLPAALKLASALGTVVAKLFVRSTERAERIYLAMCARGWR